MNVKTDNQKGMRTNSFNDINTRISKFRETSHYHINIHILANLTTYQLYIEFTS
ncbi:hypothetical protein Hanom_Chr14g01270711 [Helianthus anomalus]